MAYVHNNIYILDKFSIQQVKEALSKPALKNGLNKYEFIMANLKRVNVTDDTQFQNIFTNFYKIKEARDPELTESIFRYIEEHKYDLNVNFEEILNELLIASNKVHTSFASKVAATIDPSLPVIDAFVRKNLELEALYGLRNFNNTVQQYEELKHFYNLVLNTNTAQLWIRLFDQKYPNANITNIKKLDLILWQIR